MKKLLIFLILSIFLLTGCGLLPESRLTDIRVDPHKITLSIGEELSLIVTAYYSNNAEANVTPDCVYESSNIEIATVSNDGLIRAIKTGNAIILVTYSESNFWTGKIIKIHWAIITIE